MHWIFASLLSAVFLGLYDLSKKHALKGNAVLPVLFFSTSCSALIFGVIILLGNQAPSIMEVHPISFHQHCLLFIKSVIVGSSWTLTYFGVKRLPVSIGAPIRATGPIWTLFGALLLLGERPALLEILGIATTLLSFISLSFAGKHEGIFFHKDKGVWLMIAGTICGSISALYDKYLMQETGISPPTVLAWYFIYLALLYFPLFLAWRQRWWPRNEFHWKWSIVLISLMLVIADFIYFSALGNPDALISVVSSLRRGSTVVAFLGGLCLFREGNALRKLPGLIGILIGITLTVIG